MGIFDILKKNKDNLTIEKIMAKDYKLKYSDECNHIWESSIPKSGQASTLQGELLREIEKIRYEAQSNGNMNWDDDYSYFCDFISKKLLEQSIFSSAEKEEIVLIMSYLKECGTYARKFYNGIISESDVEIEKIAYTYDNLYDIICDKIGQLQKEITTPIPYEKNDAIKR